MDIEVCAFDHAHPLGEPATHPIARQASRLAALHPHGARRIRRAVTRQRLRCPRKVRYILPPLPQPGGTAACGVAEGRRKLSERSEFFLRPLDAGTHGEVGGSGGGLLWVTFLGRARKVTSRRATPGQSHQPYVDRAQKTAPGPPTTPLSYPPTTPLSSQGGRRIRMAVTRQRLRCPRREDAGFVGRLAANDSAVLARRTPDS